VEDARPHGGHDDHREQDRRKGEDQVGKTHDRLVDPAAEEPRDRPEDAADHQLEQDEDDAER
jgi:hypothetical protein